MKTVHVLSAYRYTSSDYFAQMLERFAKKSGAQTLEVHTGPHNFTVRFSQGLSRESYVMILDQTPLDNQQASQNFLAFVCSLKSRLKLGSLAWIPEHYHELKTEKT